MSERKLASIQKIESLEPIFLIATGEEAENIQLATVLGWKLVVRKGEFKVGDFAVYFEVDSILPEKDWSEFMRDRHFRVKTLKLGRMRLGNGNVVVSQGLALPLNILGIEDVDWGFYPKGSSPVGFDFTSILGVTKHEIPEEWTKSTGARGSFHPAVPKTDEKRIQSYPEALLQMQGRAYYITQKLDGTSCTVLSEDGLSVRVYSRNLEVGETSKYYQTALSEGVVKAALNNPGLAFQGEIVGPGIQGNKLKKTENEFYLFNIYDFVNAAYLNYDLVQEYAQRERIKTVPLIETAPDFCKTLPELESLAHGEYNAGSPQEGIVVRPIIEQFSSVLGGRLSFKVINIEFLLKEK